MNRYGSARLRAILFCGAAMFGVATANAYTISLTGGMSGGNPGGQPLYEVSGLVQGDAFNVAWGGVAGLNVTGMVMINSLTGTNADISVMLDNLSTPISGTSPRVTAVGFEIDGFSALASASAGGTYLTSASSSTFPGIPVDACATSGANCAGGGAGGVQAGGSDNFVLDVNGVFAGTLDLSNFALKIQGGPNGDSFELAGVPSVKIPEPATLGMLVIAIGLVAARRRQR